MSGDDDSDEAGAGRELPAPPIDPLAGAAMRERLRQRLFGSEARNLKIDRYELHQRIGAGGMGTVYRAYDPKMQRWIALKLLSSRRTDDLSERLRQEAGALAKLSHPNVVQVYDVGEYEDMVYLVLELVDGEDLGVWQRRMRRPWSEVLAAYIDAARGVAAAHEVKIVHRDLKPANILIGSDGRVRVADFGLARAVQGELDSTVSGSPGSPGATGPGRSGTPAYMSPEQARRVPLDERSDQFSLTVALFEALYGHRPFTERELHTVGPRELARVRRSIRGRPVPSWLAAVLLRGLAPDPSRRFPDLNAWIAEFSHGQRRQARRRRFGGFFAALGLTAVAVPALVDRSPGCPAPSAILPGTWDSSVKTAIHANLRASGLPFADNVWQLVERSLDTAVLGWSRERQALCQAERVDRTRTPEEVELGETCLSGHARALRRLSIRLRSETSAALVIHAHELVRELEDPASCNDLERLRAAAKQGEEALALQERLDEVRMLTRLAEYERALAIVNDVAEPAGRSDAAFAELLHRKAILRYLTGDLVDAARLLDEAGATAEQNADDRRSAAILGTQTELATRGTREVEAARIFGRLYAAKLQRIDAGGPTWAEYHDQMGELSLLAGDYREALAEHERAARLHADLDLVGQARSAKGAANALAELGRSEEALRRLQTARGTLARELGEAHPEVAILDANIGMTWRDLDDRPRARELLAAAVASLDRSLGAGDIRTARARTALAQAYLELGDLELAHATAEAALQTLTRQLRPGHDDILTVLGLIENVHMQRRDWAAALAVNDALIRAHQSRGQPVDAALHINAGEYLFRLGSVAESTPHYEQALAILARDDEAARLELAHALNGRAKVHLEQGQPIAAAQLLARVDLSSLTDASPELRAEVLSGQAQALWLSGQRGSAARRYAREALALFAQIDGTEAAAARLRRRLKLR